MLKIMEKREEITCEFVDNKQKMLKNSFWHTQINKSTNFTVFS